MKKGYLLVLTITAVLFFINVRLFAQCGGTITGPSAVNIGASITLSNTVGGGAWSVSSTDATITSGGVLTGITGSGIIVSYTASAGCIATKGVTVNAIGGVTCTSWDTLGALNCAPSSAAWANMKLDRNGTPYMAFVDYPAGWRCRLIKYNGSTWVSVGGTYFSPMNCNSPYLTFDTGGRPCVSFVDMDYTQKASVMRFNGSSWDTIGSRGFTPDNVQTPRISVDANNTIYVIYQGVNPSTATSVARTMKYNGSAWVSMGSGANALGPDLTTPIKLLLDGSGTPYALYYFAGHGSSVKKFDGASWSFVGDPNFISVNSNYYFSDMALNSSGIPYVVYMKDSNNQEILVKKFNGSSWVAVGAEVGHSSLPAQPTRIVIDSADNIYVSYRDVYSGNRTTVKKFEGTTWNTVGHAGFSHLQLAPYSLQVRNDGVPVVMYSYTTQATVMRLGETLGVSTGPNSICMGSTAIFSNSSSGGAWSSSNTSVASIGLSSGIATGIAIGTTNISYANNSGCVVTKQLSVNTALSDSISGATNVCVGATTTFTHPVTGGTWSSSNTTRATVNATTGVVTGVSTGTANITYTLTGGCFVTTQVTVSAILAGSISGATYMCVGATTTFTHPVSGGVWASSNTAQATVNPSTGVISGVSAGTPTITYSIGGCYKTKMITVNSTGGGSITGTTAICVGSTTVLTSGLSGTAWSSSNTGVATIGSTSGVVSGISAGTTLISFLGTTGCGSSAVVTVLSLPTAISGTLTFCKGTTTTLSSIGTTGGTWASSHTSKATIGSTTGIVTGVNGGTSIITYTWTNSCKRLATVTVNPLPVAGAIVGAGIVHVGSGTTLSPSTVGGTWASSNPAIATVTPGGSSTCTLTGISAGSVVITYTNTNACGTAFVARIFSIVSPRAGMQTGSIAFSMYPNPTTGNLTIETQQTGMLTIYAIDGRRVMQLEINDYVTSLTLPTNLVAGVYMCKFNGNDGSVVMARLVYEP